MAGETGFCLLARESYCYRELLHFGEEIELVPSHTVYLSGCNLRCAFCSEAAYVETTQHGLPAEPERLAERIRARRGEGARNVNFVGGEPTVNLLFILETLGRLPERVPVVWNSNMLMTSEVVEILTGIADVYLGDLKFGNDDCAERIAGWHDYCPVVRRNFLHAHHQANVIVRHLVMPGHIECCTRPSLEWLAEAMPGTRLSLLGAYYLPDRLVGDPRLARQLEPAEFAAAQCLARALGFDLHGQVSDAAGTRRTPERHLAARISIDDDGKVTFHDLPREFLDMAGELDPTDPDIARRRRFAQPQETAAQPHL
jgi:putative pyruvate formate lyase activating enzyme